MHPKLRYYGGFMVRARMRRAARKFFAPLGDARALQHQVLRGLLDLNGSSDFSRQHKLHEVRTPEEFRGRLPIAEYDHFRPWIERVKQGEHGALLGPQNPLKMFALTSGTTSDSKYIPITQRFLDDYRRGWSVWGIHAYDTHPALHAGNIVQLASDHDQFRSSGGQPCGNISGLVQSMQSPIVKTMYAVPDVVTKIKSAEAKYYTALRMAMEDGHVRLVMTANPSTLMQLGKLGNAYKEELIRDIADGTLSRRFEIADPIRQALARKLRRGNKRRAKELEQIASRTGRLLPRDYWPDMSLLAVWLGGSAGAYTTNLRQYFGNIPIRDHGLSASEGRMTIPFADNRPDGILDVGTHYFEFIPEAEHGSARPTVLEAHELEEGRQYFILLTTASGLYRYDIRDVVRCTGFEGTTPRLEFLNKGAHISSVTGEKISESQVVGALNHACASIDLSLSYFTVAPVWGDPPGYRLLVEATDLNGHNIAGKLAEIADDQLQSLNLEYGEKRRTGRLTPLTTEILPAGSWHRFAAARQSKLGGSVEQYKHPCLVPDLKFCEAFLRDFAQ